MITLRQQFKHLPVKFVQEISNPTESPTEKKYHQKPVLAAGLKQKKQASDQIFGAHKIYITATSTSLEGKALGTRLCKGS